MGMGEPLHNYDAVMTAMRILCDEQGLAVAPRRITLSTVGLVPRWRSWRRKPIMPNLAVSLHATTDAQRDRARADQPEVSRSRRSSTPASGFR